MTYSEIGRTGTPMSKSTIKTSPLTPAIEAESSGIDLDKPLDVATEEAIYQASLDHLVIVFRDQDIAPERLIASAQSFGDLDTPPPVYAHVPGFERIVMLANDANNPPDTDGWQTDLTFKRNPPFASILVAREIPESGGDMLWASMYAADEALPKEMKTRLEPLSAIHDMGDFRNNFAVEAHSGERVTEAMQRFGSARHSRTSSA